ncbi:Valine--pyruvate aminotransferase [Neonectria magnoliae]|uniref:Valine--pyruvate aminotransferase n=1 Tax=Neonectria magnoliae TaxID=2732573 RepID=A0ABR1I3S8_9HYPO
MPQHINLQLGWPSPSLFPSFQLLTSALEILQSPEKTSAALVYGPDAGYQPLREAIATWLTSIYLSEESIPAERICITNGASANLENILAKFTEPGYTRRIWMIEPSYFLACSIFTDAGFEGRLRGVPEDEEGLDAEFLRTNLQRVDAEEQQETPKLKTGPRYKHLYKHVIYAVPTFSNPSGKTMSLRRRRELVKLAREHDALVVTDDVYDVLRWPVKENAVISDLDHAPPRIVDLDRTLDGGPKNEWGNAVSNGSFSKIIAPGVRTGWAEATPAFILGLSQVGATRSGGCPSHLAATFVHEMIATGALEKHIRNVLIPTYRSRYYAMLRAIEEHLIPLGFRVSTGTTYEASAPNGQTNGHAQKEPAAGGYFTYISAPTDLPFSVGDLAAMALQEHDLKFAYGGMMTVEGDEGSSKRAAEGFGNGIRLCWAWHNEEEITEGIQRLARLVAEVKTK